MRGYMPLHARDVRSLLDIAALAEAHVDHVAKNLPAEHREKWYSWCKTKREKIKTLRRRLENA